MIFHDPFKLSLEFTRGSLVRHISDGLLLDSYEQIQPRQLIERPGELIDVKVHASSSLSGLSVLSFKVVYSCRDPVLCFFAHIPNPESTLALHTRYILA